MYQEVERKGEYLANLVHEELMSDIKEINEENESLINNFVEIESKLQKSENKK